MSSFEKVKKFLGELKDENIKFKKHFYAKVKERPVSEELVRKYLKKVARLLKVEEQPSKRAGEKKYKLWIRLSSRYSLVVIVTISAEKKDLYIITSWNTDRKWQRAIQR